MGGERKKKGRETEQTLLGGGRVGGGGLGRRIREGKEGERDELDTDVRFLLFFLSSFFSYTII